MRKDRASAKGLLPLMEARPWADGKTVTYRYHPIGAKPINLGTDRALAIKKVADMLGQSDGHGTLKWVWEKYSDPDAGSPRWKKLVDSSKDDYRQAWKQIDKSLGAMLINDITSPIVARYVHIERADAPKRANTEKALLSNLFGHGIKLGACSVNVTIGVEPHQLEARTEAPDTQLLEALLTWMARAAIMRTAEWERTTQRTVVPVKRVKLGVDGHPIGWCTQMVNGPRAAIQQPDLLDNLQ